MTREQALDQFKKEAAGSILKKLHKIYYQQLVNMRDEFARTLRKEFWNIIDKGKEYPQFQLWEVQFSYLRTHIMDGTYQWLVELHDENGDYTSTDISQIFDMKVVIGIYDKYRQELYEAAAKYVNILTPADCDLIMTDYFGTLSMYLYILGVYAFRGLAQDDRWKEVEKEDKFRILLGERRGQTFVVYSEGWSQKKAGEVIEKLSQQPTEQDFTSADYMLYDFSDMQIQEADICFRNFNFSNFRRCLVEESDVKACQCMYTDWQGCHIRNAVMDGNCMCGADFGSSILENVSMAGVRLDVLPYSEENILNLTLIPVSFHNAILQNVDFSGAFLAECDFHNARIGRVNFEGADMRNSRIDKKYKDILQLSEEQKNSICWLSE